MEHHLIDRARGEYREMPGLILTPQQMKRLLGCSDTECQTVLTHLIAEKFLVRTHDGQFRRRD